VRSVHRVLADGARLSLSMDLDTVTAPQQRLRRILVEVGLAGLAAAVLALLATTRAALAPLDAITALARSISHGQRGRRLTPARVDTELGRTALAFDGMLDALEGVESHARAEQRRAEVAEMNALAAAERMRRFLDDAAHELRTPICGILAAAEASASPRLDAEQRERLQLLLISEAHRGQRLVEDLLTLARLDAGAPAQRAPVDLYELVEQETRRVGLLAPDLRFTRLGGPATVTGDGAQLARLVVNLLDNARAHTPDGGTIVIRTERDPSAGQATLSVTDAGCGVPAEDRERIFDRLTRLDTARTRPGGSGLGLAIARASRTPTPALCVAPSRPPARPGRASC
jgi:signal transduction histidine kinase